MSMRGWTRTVITIAAGMLLGGIQASSQTSTETPEDLQRALQRRYQLVRNFTADFTQTYEGGMLRTRMVERGTVLVARPGLMRWDYLDPEPKQIVSDGAQLFFYFPEDEQVMVGQLPAESEATTPALFLAGGGGGGRGGWGRPPPLRAEPDFEYLTLVIDAGSLAIRRLIAYDLQGGVSTFAFSNLQENLDLSDNSFEFEIPDGTDVITHDGSDPLQ